MTLTVGNNVVLSGARSFGLHVEALTFSGLPEGRYPFTLTAQVQGDASIAEQVSGLLTIQHSAENARPPGHSVVNGVDIATGNLGLSQEDVPAIGNRGLSLSENGQSAEALAILRRGVARFPGVKYLYKNAGRAAFELGDTAQAMQHLDRALQLDPQFSDAQALRARVRGMAAAPSVH